MKIMKPILLAAALMFVGDAVAQQSPIQVTGGMTFSAFDDDMGDTEALGYRAAIGYNINDNVLFELGYADFSAFSGKKSDNLRAMIVETDFLLPVSDYASFYTGMGGALSSQDTNLTASFGIKYQLSYNWYLDLSYQGIFDLVRKYDDLYSFNTLLSYRFSSNEPEESVENIDLRPSINNVVNEETVELIPEPEVSPDVYVEKKESCEKVLNEYRVVTGDYLHKIANKLDISLDELISINSKFYKRNINLIYPGEKLVYQKLSCSN